MSSLDVLIPRGVWHDPTVGSAGAVDITAVPSGGTLQTSGNLAAGQPVYVKSIVVSFSTNANGGDFVTFRGSSATGNYIVVRQERAAGNPLTIVLDDFSFYAANGLEVIGNIADTAAVTVTFFDTGF